MPASLGARRGLKEHAIARNKQIKMTPVLYEKQTKLVSKLSSMGQFSQYICFLRASIHVYV